MNHDEIMSWMFLGNLWNWDLSSLTLMLSELGKLVVFEEETHMFSLEFGFNQSCGFYQIKWLIDHSIFFFGEYLNLQQDL